MKFIKQNETEKEFIPIIYNWKIFDELVLGLMYRLLFMDYKSHKKFLKNTLSQQSLNLL